VNFIEFVDNAVTDRLVTALLYEPLAPIVWGRRSKLNYENLRKFGQTLHTRLTSDQVLDYLDPRRIGGENNEELYDYRFILRLLISLSEPGAELSSRRFIEANALSLAFAATMRSRYSSIFYSSSKIVSNVPTNGFLTLLLNAADPVYAPILSFLLLKPTIDTENVPEFYKLFLSSSTEHSHDERHWILTLIADSLIEPNDYNILQKRYGIKLCLSLFTSNMSDMESRKLVLMILRSALRHESVAKDLFLRQNLQSWIALTIQLWGTIV
uniref:Nucleolar pre-ribosomal-associated protein 1 C-terminal domain-containing protein n=1 Tax=Parascaris equorum TaxID=6256 RepID=A0A914RZM0_PAREQ